jgi:CBS domain-containing protein
MRAKDIMTTRVITVSDDTPVEEIARTLLKWRISAVPVVGADERMVGLVSEGDLVLRPEARSDGEGSWWLSGLIEPEERARRYAKARGHLAKDVMTTKVITADENDTLVDLAMMLEEHGIKRVPILRRGRLIGIVSRANLLHGLAALPGPESAAEAPARLATVRKPLGPDDRAIRATILNTVHNDIDVRGSLNVIVSKGVVDLWGGVETEVQRQAVRAAAENVPNVVAVKDHLTVLPAAIRRSLRAEAPE